MAERKQRYEIYFANAYVRCHVTIGAQKSRALVFCYRHDVHARTPSLCRHHWSRHLQEMLLRTFSTLN